MAFKLPEFLVGSGETLLRAKWAQVVGGFINAWNNVKVVRGDKDELRISDSNVVLTLKESEAGEATELHYDADGFTVDIDGNGIAIENGGGETITIFRPGTNSVRIESGGITVNFSPDGFSIVTPDNSTQINYDGTMNLTRLSNGKVISLDASGLVNSVTIDTDGVTVTNGTNVTANIGVGGFHYEDGSIRVEGFGYGLEVENISTSKTLSIAPGDLTADMSIREIDVCDGGVAKKMLVVASAPYTP